MSIVLPQELKTSKVKALPDDLKKIAEEMLAKKFDIKEEVVFPKWEDPFLDINRGAFAGTGFNGAGGATTTQFFGEFQPGYQDQIYVESQPWSNNRVAKLRIRHPAENELISALQRFDKQNMRGKRSFIMSREFCDYVRSWWRFTQHGGIEGVGQIFGCDVIVSPQVQDCVLEARF